MSESISRSHENDQPVLETHEERTETHACDLISRQAAIEALYIPDYENGEAYSQYVDDKRAIELVPPAQPERKRGKWTQILNADRVTHDYRCSECHRFRFHNGEMLKKYKYCPNCGADMRGEQDETD